MCSYITVQKNTSTITSKSFLVIDRRAMKILECSVLTLSEHYFINHFIITFIHQSDFPALQDASDCLGFSNLTSINSTKKTTVRYYNSKIIYKFNE